jgi:hypothetical protein
MKNIQNQVLNPLFKVPKTLIRSILIEGRTVIEHEIVP